MAKASASSLRFVELSLALAAASCGNGAGAPSVASDASAVVGDASDVDAFASVTDAAGDATVIDAQSSTSDAGTEGGAMPIVAPPDTWTWIDFPESKCASGTATGIAVNPHSGATELLIYFEGGGSCHDATSCWGANPGATNLGGYDKTTFASAKQLAYPPLVRSVAGNPFAAMNIVFVPYCTGDLHFGTAKVDLVVGDTPVPTFFYGATDLELFLRRLVVTFPSPARVVSYGTSAGGFASFLDYDRIARAFGVRVDILDDSGPPLTRMGQSDNATLFSLWGGAVPASCAGCNSFLDVMKADRTAQPASRLAFLSLAEDTTISADFGYSLSAYGPAIEALFAQNFGGDANVATYIVADDPGHVVESQAALAPEYLPWMAQFTSDDPSWGNGGFDAGIVDAGADGM